ncbi:hypothetical protein PP352_21675 [Mycobacteroides abscessus]|nr:hypothetical protein [Mycobacteroides abscessus]
MTDWAQLVIHSIGMSLVWIIGTVVVWQRIRLRNSMVRGLVAVIAGLGLAVASTAMVILLVHA